MPAANPSIGVVSDQEAGDRRAAKTSARGWAIGFGSPAAFDPTSSSKLTFTPKNLNEAVPAANHG